MFTEKPELLSKSPAHRDLGFVSSGIGSAFVILARSIPIAISFQINQHSRFSFQSAIDFTSNSQTIKDHVAKVAALVAVVFIMQPLVQVSDEMNHEIEGLRPAVSVGVPVFQSGEELFRLGNHAIPVRAFVAPACHGVSFATVQEIASFGLRRGRQILVGELGMT